jgi:hypothetical protein
MMMTRAAKIGGHDVPDASKQQAADDAALRGYDICQCYECNADGQHDQDRLSFD